MVSQCVTGLDVELPLKDMPIWASDCRSRHPSAHGDEKDFGKYWGKMVQGVKIVSSRMLVQELRLS